MMQADTWQLAQQWLLLNKPYQMNEAYGEDAPNSARFVERSGGLLITAPHAVHHYRSSDVPDKQSDARSGGLCELFGRQLSASTLAASGFVTEWHSWGERQDMFKNSLQTMVASGKFVVDLHGMNDAHGVDICIGLGAHPTERSQHIAEVLQAALRPLAVSINQPFGARSPHTVTSFVQSLGGEAFQIEIAAHLRNPAQDPAMAEEFIQNMVGALSQVADIVA